MTRTGWRQGLRDLVRDVTRVLFVYALMLQMLAPVVYAQAEAGSGGETHAVLCSAMAAAVSEAPGKAPAQVVHNCQACCLASAVAILTPPAQLAAPTSFSVEMLALVPGDIVTLTRHGGPPPQRAPPGFA